MKDENGEFQEISFRHFAKSEGRFRKQFDKEGNPSPTILKAEEDRLSFWNRLQDMAGIDRIIPGEEQD